MRRAWGRTACGVTAALVVAVGLQFGASAGNGETGPVRARVGSRHSGSDGGIRAGLSHYDARVRASFVVGATADGQVQMLMRTAGLEVDKTVARDGSFTVVLASGEDRLTVAMGYGGVEVSRGDRALHLDLGQSGDEQFLEVKRLLAGSMAVRLHRLVASNLEPATLRTPAGMGTLLTDAFIGLLDGDVAAIDRLGAQFAKAAAAKVRRVRVEDMDSCYLWWENEVLEAFYSLAACKFEYSFLNPLKEICNLRYVMRVEAAWFQFLGCCAFPIRMQ